MLELPSTAAAAAQVTLLETAEELDFDFAIPDIPLNRLEQLYEEEDRHEIARAADITLDEEDMYLMRAAQAERARRYEEPSADILYGPEEEDLIAMAPLGEEEAFLYEPIEVPREAAVPPGEAEEVVGLHVPEKVAPVPEPLEIEHEPMPIEIEHEVSTIPETLEAPSVELGVGPEFEEEAPVRIGVRRGGVKRARGERYDAETQLSSRELAPQDTTPFVVESHGVIEPGHGPARAVHVSPGTLPDWLAKSSVQTLAPHLASYLSSCFISAPAARPEIPPPKAEGEGVPPEEAMLEGPPEVYEELPPPVHEEEYEAMPLPEYQPEEYEAEEIPRPETRDIDEVLLAPAEEVPGVQPPEGQPAFAGWSDRTIKMFYALRGRLTDATPSTTLQTLIEGKSRSTAAAIFLETLVLKTHDYIDIAQSEPYGDIAITRSSRFDEEVPGEIQQPVSA